jgi:hypothetical protein
MCEKCNKISRQLYKKDCEGCTCDCHFTIDENGEEILKKKDRLYFTEEDWKKLLKMLLEIIK